MTLTFPDSILISVAASFVVSKYSLDKCCELLPTSIVFKLANGNRTINSFTLMWFVKTENLKWQKLFTTYVSYRVIKAVANRQWQLRLNCCSQVTMEWSLEETQLIDIHSNFKVLLLKCLTKSSITTIVLQIQYWYLLIEFPFLPNKILWKDCYINVCFVFKK